MFGLGEKEKEVVVDPIKKEIDSKYASRLHTMIMEEIRMPGTYATKVLSRIVSIYKMNEINDYVYNTKQIISIIPNVIGGTAENVVIAYWRIDDVNNKVYKEIEAQVRGKK